MGLDHQTNRDRPGRRAGIAGSANDYIAALVQEIKQLEQQAAALADEIEELTGSPSFGEANQDEQHQRNV